MSYLLQLAMQEELQLNRMPEQRGILAVSIGIPKVEAPPPSLLDIAVTGIGKVAAATVVSSFLTLGRGKSGVVSLGYCGALSENLRIGDVFVPDYGACTLRGEWLARPGQRTLQYENHSFDSVLYHPDQSLVDRLITACSNAELPVVTGVLASGDRFLALPEIKASTDNKVHADAIDMESAAVAQACELHETPFAALRTISDLNTGTREAEYLSSIINVNLRYTAVLNAVINALTNTQNTE